MTTVRTWPAIVMAGLLTLSAAAATAQVATLGDEDDGEPTPPPVAAELAGEEAMLEFAACLRDNGIEVDDPRFGVGGGGFALTPDGELPFDPESSEFQAAMQACGSFLQAMLPDFGAELEAEIADTLYEVSVCMRELGWEDFPDLGIDQDPMTVFVQLEELGIDLSDPSFLQDATTCQAESGLDEFGLPGL